MVILESFYDIPDSDIDPDSPLNQRFFQYYRDNDGYLRDAIVASPGANLYTNHHHDGVDSKIISKSVTRIVNTYGDFNCYAAIPDFIQTGKTISFEVKDGQVALITIQGGTIEGVQRDLAFFDISIDGTAFYWPTFTSAWGASAPIDEDDPSEFTTGFHMTHMALGLSEGVHTAELLMSNVNGGHSILVSQVGAGVVMQVLVI